jgi:integrase
MTTKVQRESADVHAGTLIRTASGHYFAQFSIGGGQRKGTLLRTCETEEQAERRKVAIAKLVARLRDSGHTTVIANTIREAGQLDEEGMRKLAKLVERIANGKEPGLETPPTARRSGLTVAELADLWTSGELATQYPDHVRVKRSSDDDRRLLAWLGNVRMPDGTTFGHHAVASVTLDECDHVMTALPKTAQTPSTRRQYAQAIRKLLTYAVYPLRLLPALPIPKGWLPKGGSGKSKQWIYPSEDVALMQCRAVPLARRLFYGLLVREGLRVREALSLTWADVDLERGVLRLDTNKTEDPRSWAMGEDVSRALNAWRTLRGGKAEKVTRLFPRGLVGERCHLAPRLRQGLTLASVKRPELTEPKKGRLPLRAHDLRGTFVTLALAAGRTEAWVTDRTGHRSSAMIYLYKRAARTASELGLGWLAPLDESIPELSSSPRQGANGVQTAGLTGRGRSPGRSKTSGRSHFATGRVASAAIANPLHVGSNPILTSRPISGGRNAVRSTYARRSPCEVACPAGRIAACDAARG